MNSFRFKGEIPGSKSVFNRALIVKSYFSDLDLKGFSDCDDVRFMRSGLTQLFANQIVDCGEGGTTFRFMAVRASRIPGTHTLKGTQRLLERPQQGLYHLLQQLGVVDIKQSGRDVVMTSRGWMPHALKVDSSESSQYASALVLNAWGLDFDLNFEIIGNKVSESYFLMTVHFLKKMGMKILNNGNHYTIPAGQALKVWQYRVESDLSSAFTIAAAGALSGEAVLENFPYQSHQPDKAFIDILKSMHVDLKELESSLVVKAPTKLKAIHANLFQSPDLFPVLAVLCSWAEGISRLDGAPQLVAKESNRIQKVADLFKLLGVSHQILSDGMIIHGNPQQQLKSKISFDPDQDHRMVMAASLMKLKGHDISILHPEAIHKSFPEFWDMIGMKP